MHLLPGIAVQDSDCWTIRGSSVYQDQAIRCPVIGDATQCATSSVIVGAKITWSQPARSRDPKGIDGRQSLRMAAGTNASNARRKNFSDQMFHK
jgi:hypothetical protein